MYGMVNNLLVEALKDEYGTATWEAIEKRSGADSDFFVAMEQYPDEVTYTIVGTASDILGISVDRLLELFGKKWVEMTSKGEYGHYYAMADDLFDFLKNLNSLHQSLGAGLDELRPPSFRFLELDDGSVELHYLSQRPGLTHFVLGLIEGLASHYGQEIEVEITARKESGAHQDQFRISLI